MDLIGVGVCALRFRAKMEQHTKFQALLLESQGQSLALTVLSKFAGQRLDINAIQDDRAHTSDSGQDSPSSDPISLRMTYHRIL
jgi:hypothetical protein